MSITHRVKRTLGVATAGAMVLSLMPAGAAFAEFDDVCEGAPENDFDDADSISETQEPFVDCMAAYGITVGDNDGDFNPGEFTSRQHMALFLARTVSQAEDGDITIPVDEDDEFSDISDISPEEARHAINWLEERGLIEGYEDGTYRPAVDVNRGQMASFIVRLMVELGVTLPATTDDHFDDDDGTFHEDNINILAEMGIVQGFGDGTYRPGAEVTRQQMAAYVIGAVIEIDEAGNWNGEFVDQPTESNQTFDVTPGDAAENEVSASSTSNEGARQYSVSGLDDDTTYDIVLYPAANVTEDENGFVTFRDADGANNAGNDEADRGSPVGVIEVINGVAVTTPSAAEEASPSNGTISFTIDSTDTGSVIPVVFVDEENDDTVELDEDNAPTADEPFGIGGEKTWVAAEASSGAIATSNVDDVDKDANRFSACEFALVPGAGPIEATDDCFSYFYDDNDTFTVDSIPATMAEFEAALSENDDIDGTYSTNPDLSSTFDLTDESPSAPTGVDATEQSDTEILVEWVEPASGEADEYVVYSANVEEDDFAGPTFDPAVDCPDATTSAGFAQYTEEARVAGDADDLEYTDEGLEAESAHCYTVTAIQDDQESDAAAEDGAQTESVADTGDPIFEDARIEDLGTLGEIDSADTIQFRFSESMDTTTVNSWAFIIEDEDGDRFQLDCGGATCTPDDSDTAGGDTDDVLVITNAAAGLTDLNTDGNGDPNIPSTIVLANSLVTDESGNRVDLAESDDVVIDDEGNLVVYV